MVETGNLHKKIFRLRFHKNHMIKNKHLHDIFRFEPATTRECSDDFEQHKPEFEEVFFRVFVTEVKRRDCKKNIFLKKANNGIKRIFSI